VVVTNVIHVQFRNHRPVVLDERTSAILELDKALSRDEGRVATIVAKLESTTGRAAIRLRRELVVLKGRIGALERARTRLAGPELALLPGGRK
jgi:hypothetical protein